MRIAAIAAAFLLALASGSLAQAQAGPLRASAPRHPVSGLPVIPLTVTHNGKPHLFRVEAALSGVAQERGLMFRTSMGADEGMIFPMKPARPASFWMKNTILSLDIIFIGTDHRVLNIAERAQPYSEMPLFSAGLVSAVLELNGGRAAQLGIAPGDLVTW
ncbi:MAG: hypothetical protein RLZZ136_374 [Pseudomonadota bacterium]